ncbi:MAG: DUF885 family protein [Fimbriimonadaceae bacterium]
MLSTVLLAMLAPNDDPGLRAGIEQYSADRSILLRKYPLEGTAERNERLARFYSDTQRELEALDFEALGREGKVDYVLLDATLQAGLAELKTDQAVWDKVFALAPFATQVLGLEAARRDMSRLDPQETAGRLAALAKEIAAATQGLAAKPKTEPTARERSEANRAVQSLGRVRDHFDAWFKFYSGYDPMFTWWCSAPGKEVGNRLEAFQSLVRERLVGVAADDKTTIIGFPIGREALEAALRAEMMPYTTDELLAAADREFAWCEAELARAAKEMGYDRPMDAIEAVKKEFVPPGEQPALVKGLAEEAVAYLEEHDLVTIPPLCKESWRMEMLTPEQQLQSPFFLGGETIMVSYPTDGMSHEAKMMSLRGNNPYFSRATVQHELIPGHHLQGFMLARHRPYRSAFGTPFWIEGWALYWEMLLWDLGFPKTAAQKVGMLFWRMHRCARIQFSLRFHLGEMTPQECVDLLVEKVGHERENALAEVRRSFAGSYPPLYQAAYMLGGLQLMALKRGLVDSGKMSYREFHDSILQGNQMPIAAVAARLTGEGLTRGFRPAKLPLDRP